MTRVLVIGASGMLGSMVVDVLSQDPRLRVTATVRNAAARDRLRPACDGVNWSLFDVLAPDENVIAGHDWIVNAVGITKPLIRDNNPEEVERAIRVNAVFPHELGSIARRSGARVLQIATDCVYSGARGRYRESDPHDALDVYGKSKSLGESWQENVHHLRCSIIGPEPKDYKFLVEWFRRQPRNAAVKGFRNHLWNGVTTLHFARLCQGVITGGIRLGHLHHVIPAGAITKAEMLSSFAEAYGRRDIQIDVVDAATVIDRTLETENPDLNNALWRPSGYSTPPTVPEMIAELAAWNYRMACAAA